MSVPKESTCWKQDLVQNPHAMFNFFAVCLHVQADCPWLHCPHFLLYVQFFFFLLSFSSFIPPLTPRMTSAPGMAVSRQFVLDCSPSLPFPSLTLPLLPAACTPPEMAAPPESWLFSLNLSSFIKSVTPVLTSVVGMAVFCVWMFSVSFLCFILHPLLPLPQMAAQPDSTS